MSVAKRCQYARPSPATSPMYVHHTSIVPFKGMVYAVAGVMYIQRRWTIVVLIMVMFYRGW